MKVVILGGGPTGLRIADELSSNPEIEIELYEKEDKLGGCWKVDWEEGYYKEHSPRVITTGYTKTLKLLKDLNVDTKNLYGGRVGTSLMFASYLLNNLSTFDLIKFMYSLYTIRKSDKRSLNEWMDDNNISENGRKIMIKFCLSIGTNENKMVAYCLFTAISQGQGSKFLQLPENDLWIELLERKLNNKSNVSIFKKSELKFINSNSSEVEFVNINNKKIRADYFICAIPLYGLRNVMGSSSKYVQNNWMTYEKFKKYSIKSSYSGIGFQLHFNRTLPKPELWKLETVTDWYIEIISISDYSNKYSKNANIKTVWSCVIVATNKKSTFLNKSANDLKNIKDVINESIRQIELNINMILNPTKVTVAQGVRYNNKINMWDMDHSAYNPSEFGEMKSKGKLKNIYSVGPHNLYDIASLETSLGSADLFLKEFNQK